jgi:hypothetical protein
MVSINQNRNGVYPVNLSCRSGRASQNNASLGKNCRTSCDIVASSVVVQVVHPEAEAMSERGNAALLWSINRAPYVFGGNALPVQQFRMM